MAETTTPQTQPGLLNSILPLAVIGIGGIAIYKWLGIAEERRKEAKSEQVREETAQAQTQAQASTQQTKALATQTFVSGVNMLGKNVNKNVNNTAEELQSIFYGKTGEYLGRPYWRKKNFITDKDSARAKMLIFEFPSKKLNTLIRWYGFLNPQNNLIKDVELTNGTDKISLQTYFELAKQKKLF